MAEKLHIWQLLQRREMGYTNSRQPKQLRSACVRWADSLMVHQNVIKTIPCIDDSSRSSYMADSNDQGMAATTHSNRCISLINTGMMKRVAEIGGHQRTVWTLCFHPFDPNLLATGNLGGVVCVFHKTVLLKSQTNDSNPITSVTFHPYKSVIFYAISNRVIVWDYEEDIILQEVHGPVESRIKYVKYNPSCDMLITGIRKENLVSYIHITDEPDENYETPLISCSTFMDHLMNSLSLIIDNMESRSIVDLKLHWSHFRMEAHLFYKLLQNDRKIQLKPEKFIGDYNMSLKLMKRRIDHIVQLVSNVTLLVGSYSMENTFKEFEHIVQSYKAEAHQMNAMDDFDFSLLMGIITAIEKILILDEFPEEARAYAKTLNYQYHLQVWMMNTQESQFPDFSQDWRNVIGYCYIHNDSTVEISKCGKRIASFRELKNRQLLIAVQSLEPSNLGECLFTYQTYAGTIMSLSFSPSLDYLLVGVRSNEIFGYFLKLQSPASEPPERRTVLLLNNLNNDDVISYLKWSARPGDGIIIGYKTYQLRCLIRR